MTVRIVLSAVALLMASGCAPQGDQAPDGAESALDAEADEGGVVVRPGDRIVFLGDSITQAAVEPGGYVVVLDSLLRARHLQLEAELVGAGISGNKVPDLLARLDRDVLSRDPDVVVVYIGINDVWHWFEFDPEGTERDVYQRGLGELLSRIANTGARILLCTPSVIGEAPGFETEEDRMLDDYAGISRTVAGQAGVPVCDLRVAFKAYLKAHNAAGLSAGVLTSDGVHLNRAGNAFVAEQILSRFDIEE